MNILYVIPFKLQVPLLLLTVTDLSKTMFQDKKECGHLSCILSYTIYFLPRHIPIQRLMEEQFLSNI